MPPGGVFYRRNRMFRTFAPLGPSNPPSDVCHLTIEDDDDNDSQNASGLRSYPFPKPVMDLESYPTSQTASTTTTFHSSGPRSAPWNQYQYSSSASTQYGVNISHNKAASFAHNLSTSSKAPPPLKVVHTNTEIPSTGRGKENVYRSKHFADDQWLPPRRSMSSSCSGSMTQPSTDSVSDSTSVPPPPCQTQHVEEPVFERLAREETASSSRRKHLTPAIAAQEERARRLQREYDEEVAQDRAMHGSGCIGGRARALRDGASKTSTATPRKTASRRKCTVQRHCCVDRGVLQPLHPDRELQRASNLAALPTARFHPPRKERVTVPPRTPPATAAAAARDSIGSLDTSSELSDPLGDDCAGVLLRTPPTTVRRDRVPITTPLVLLTTPSRSTPLHGARPVQLDDVSTATTVGSQWVAPHFDSMEDHIRPDSPRRHSHRHHGRSESRSSSRSSQHRHHRSESRSSSRSSQHHHHRSVRISTRTPERFRSGAGTSPMIVKPISRDRQLPRPILQDRSRTPISKLELRRQSAARRLVIANSGQDPFHSDHTPGYVKARYPPSSDGSSNASSRRLRL